jgi:DNA (cytosine-5)-methyltransferase 1
MNFNLRTATSMMSCAGTSTCTLRAAESNEMNGPTALSLYSGAGGLDLGLEAAGINHVLFVENDVDARSTISLNRPAWKLATPGDIHQHDPSDLVAMANVPRRELDILIAGPPCQPFSKSGYWATGDSKRLADPRADTLDAFLNVLEVALPRVMLIENVRGMAFRGKDEGLRHIEHGLLRINRARGTNYTPVVLQLNAADFGVPQFRERVFVVAARSGKIFTAPQPTHGPHGDLIAYRTAWDAIGGFNDEAVPADLLLTGRWAALLPAIPEGKNYLWHTPRNEKQGGKPLFGWRTRYWSFLLKLSKSLPSWTIQASPGPATGPFHWNNRLLSVQELCRLQTFPEGFHIFGSRRSAQRQVGNAVPSAIGELLGLEIRRQLLGQRVRKNLTLVPATRADMPRQERVGRVPRKYLVLRAKHRAHPGTGLGPSARRRQNHATN